MSQESGSTFHGREGMVEKLRELIHPVQESLLGDGFLDRSLSFLKEVGATRVTALIIDGDYVFRSERDDGIEADAAIERGLESLTAKRHAGRNVALIAQGSTDYLHVVLSMRYAHKHSKHEPGIAILVSAIPLESQSEVNEPSSRPRTPLEREILLMKEQVETVEVAREELLRELSESAARLFEGSQVKVSSVSI